MSNSTKRSSRLVKKSQLIDPKTLPAKTPTEAVKPTVINDFGEGLMNFRRDEAAKNLGEGAGNLVKSAVTGVSNNGIWMVEHAVADTAFFLSNAAELITRKTRNAGLVAGEAAKDKEREVIQGLTAKAYAAGSEVSHLSSSVGSTVAQNFKEGISEMKSAQEERREAKLQQRIDDGEDVRSLAQKVRDRINAYTGEVLPQAVIETEDNDTLSLPEAVEPVIESVVEAAPAIEASTKLGKLLISEHAKA
ncbi:hypothetical protein [Acaryochloris marina]|uniref:hypothetical protein n=1 Tax=Acaryochloris marina TaxID=155978 RepID=UPI001BAF2F5D|nr:hypothetical protein [Acaryochloris marina]QUY46017.1 hypothetical protein I1H34_30315 [Acaryochloris marina S15]